MHAPFVILSAAKDLITPVPERVYHRQFSPDKQDDKRYMTVLMAHGHSLRPQLL
jgi:hypothetical protein